MKGVPQRKTFLSTRPSTNEDAPSPGTVCDPVGGCSPRGHSGTLLSEGGGSVPEAGEPASGRDELDDNPTQFREMQVERDRLRVELRDALGQVEYWRTLPEYRKTMLVEQRENTDSGREFLSTGHPAVRSSRRRFRIT